MLHWPLKSIQRWGVKRRTCSSIRSPLLLGHHTDLIPCLGSQSCWETNPLPHNLKPEGSTGLCWTACRELIQSPKTSSQQNSSKTKAPRSHSPQNFDPSAKMSPGFNNYALYWGCSLREHIEHTLLTLGPFKCENNTNKTTLISAVCGC